MVLFEWLPETMRGGRMAAINPRRMMTHSRSRTTSHEPAAGHILVTMKLPGHGIRNVFALELKQGANWQCANAARYADPATTLDSDYDADKASYARFTCMFPCHGNDGNRSIVPGDCATRLTWDNDIVEAGSGRKRGKTSADLPDIFDTWVCFRGTRPDLKTAAQCIRDTPVAATANGKGFEGAQK